MHSTTLNPYKIRCGCGHTWSGGRLSRPQNVPCPECGDRFLVLPEPPPMPGSFTNKNGQRKRRKRSGQLTWRWPFSLSESLVLLLGLALVLAGYLWKLNHPVGD